MDVHTPKPVHSLRELAREIGIIVIGVLIALGGEQLVVALNRAYEARATEEALRKEVGVSLISAAERVMVSSCLTARLVGLSHALNRSGGEWRANLLPTGAPKGEVLPQVYRAPARAWITSSWQAVLASGGAAHLNHAQLRAYGYYYREIETFRADRDSERTLIAAVQPLAYDLTLSADKRVEMLANLAALDRINFEMTTLAEQFIEFARRHGFQPDSATLEDRFRGDSAFYGSCVQRLGSTADALPPGTR
jgi:hypothetical protein